MSPQGAAALAAVLALAAAPACGRAASAEPDAVTAMEVAAMTTGAMAASSPPVEDHGIVVRDAWARPTPPGMSDAALYLQIESTDAPTDALLGGRSPRCLGVIAHRSTIRADGVALMTTAAPDDLRLRPGERLTFGPDGLHLMCTGIDAPLEDGQRFEVQLYFEQRSPLTITVTVQQR